LNQFDTDLKTLIDSIRREIALTHRFNPGEITGLKSKHPHSFIKHQTTAATGYPSGIRKWREYGHSALTTVSYCSTFEHFSRTIEYNR
jgi:hypothetical protein